MCQHVVRQVARKLLTSGACVSARCVVCGAQDGFLSSCYHPTRPLGLAGAAVCALSCAAHSILDLTHTMAEFDDAFHKLQQLYVTSMIQSAISP